MFSEDKRGWDRKVSKSSSLHSPSPFTLGPSLGPPKKECCISWSVLPTQRRLSYPRLLIIISKAVACKNLARIPPPFYRRAMSERSRPIQNVECCAQGDASVQGAGLSVKSISIRFMYGVQPVAIFYERLTRDIVGDDHGAIGAGAVTR